MTTLIKRMEIANKQGRLLSHAAVLKQLKNTSDTIRLGLIQDALADICEMLVTISEVQMENDA
jgi:hypothetical protein